VITDSIGPGSPHSCSRSASSSADSGRDTARQLFLDTRRFARALTQVVKLGAANITAALDFDRGDQGRVGLERPLYTFARRNLANDERGVQAAIALGNHHTFKSLHTLAGALDHIDAHNDGVTRGIRGKAFVQTSNFFLLKGLNQVHKMSISLHFPFMHALR
jgi:hypothetical protein